MYLEEGAGGGARRFASQHLLNNVILTRCILVQRQFGSSYAYSIVGFEFSNLSRSDCLFSFGYSLTNSWGTAIFDHFRLISAFFRHFLPISSKWVNNFSHLFNDISPSDNPQLKIIPSTFCCVVHSDLHFNWTEFTNFCAAHFRFRQFLNILTLPDFVHLPNFSFFMDKDYNGESCVSISFSNFDKFGCKHWDLIEKATNFGTGECKYAKTWGGGGRARGQRWIQIHTYRYFFLYLKQFVFTPPSL